MESINKNKNQENFSTKDLNKITNIFGKESVKIIGNHLVINCEIQKVSQELSEHYSQETILKRLSEELNEKTGEWEVKFKID